MRRLLLAGLWWTIRVDPAAEGEGAIETLAPARLWMPGPSFGLELMTR